MNIREDLQFTPINDIRKRKKTIIRGGCIQERYFAKLFGRKLANRVTSKKLVEKIMRPIFYRLGTMTENQLIFADLGHE